MSKGGMKAKRSYAVRIMAPNDASGNPRRGWLVYRPNGDLICFVEEGYSGEQAFRKRRPGTIVLSEINVGAKEWNRWKRIDRERELEAWPEGGL